MSLEAYRSTLRASEQPRGIERRLLLRHAAALAAHAPGLADARDGAGRLAVLAAGLGDALRDNLALWRALKHDLGAEANALPPRLRADLIGLALWVERRTDDVLGGREGVSALADLNRSLAAGLSGRPR